MAMRETDLQENDRFLGRRVGIENTISETYSADAPTSTATTGNGSESVPPVTITDSSNNTTLVTAGAEAAGAGSGAADGESGITAASIIAGMSSSNTGESAYMSAAHMNASSYDDYGATGGGWDNPEPIGTRNGYSNSTPAQQSAVDNLVSTLQNGGTDGYNPASAQVAGELTGVLNEYGGDAIKASSAINADANLKGVNNVAASGDSDNKLTLYGPNQATGDGLTPIATTQAVNSDSGGTDFGVNDPTTWDSTTTATTASSAAATDGSGAAAATGTGTDAATYSATVAAATDNGLGDSSSGAVSDLTAMSLASLGSDNLTAIDSQAAFDAYNMVMIANMVDDGFGNG